MSSGSGSVERRAWNRLEPEIRSALEVRIVRDLAGRSTSGAMVYFVVSLVLVFATPYYKDHAALLTAVAAAELVAGGLRLFAARRVLRETGRRYNRLLLSATYASFAVWGVFCAWTIHLYAGEWTAMLLLLCTASLAGGATSSLAPSLPLARKCLILLVAPTVIAALTLGDIRHLGLSMLAAIYLVFLLAQAKVNGRDFWEAGVAAEREKIRGSLERQRAETERASLVAAIEQSAEEILITDSAGNIRYCNLSFERMSGYTRAEAAGRGLRFLSAGEPADKAERELSEALRTGGTWSGLLVNRARNGSQYHVEGTISPIAEMPGALSGFVWAAHDVTERLRLEDQLHQAQQMESIGRLAGGVAHDFNNLLTVIKGYAGLLEGVVAEERPRGYAGLISKAADQGASLTRQLLTFSRKQLIRPAALQLNQLVSDLRTMLQRMVGENIELRTELDPSLGWVKADPDQISQILVNLATNARDAMPKGGTLLLRTMNCAAGVGLEVTDTGVGMSPEIQASIFEPFFTTKERGRGRGTGLGLSTVYGIVAQSGGRIQVSSEQGRGTTFRIELPQIASAAMAAAAGDDTSTRVRGVERVLVVEDHEDLRAFVVAALRDSGFDVLEAKNGREAIALSEREQQTIHLLLTDVIMPHMTGKEVADLLAKARPEMKVLFISGYSGDVIAPHGVLDSDVAYLPKPFSRQALVDKVRESLG